MVAESESAELSSALRDYVDNHALLITSTLGWVEVGRVVRARFDAGYTEVADGVDEALSGVGEHRIDDALVSLSRRLDPNQLRPLDAIHLASALVVDADLFITYEQRLAEAAAQNGLRCAAPGREL